MKNKKYSPRHSLAFVLLFLARGPNYGGGVFKMMQEEIPCFVGDNSMIYRMLQHLEQEGSVEANWKIPDSGRPVRFYNLTDKGWNQLLDAEDDISNRIKNHMFFLSEVAKEKIRKNNT